MGFLKGLLITDVITCVFLDKILFFKRKNAIVGFYVVLSYPNAKWWLKCDKVKISVKIHHQNDVLRAVKVKRCNQPSRTTIL